MILTGEEIRKQVERRRIVLDPFDEAQLNPNSYNVRLGTKVITYLNTVLDPKVPQPTEELTIGPGGLLLRSDRIYLGHTVERLGSEHYVPIVKGRSSSARLGLFVHVTADLIDIGSVGQLTLQLFAVQPIVVYAGMLLAQVTFWVTEGQVVLYAGKYQGSKGPVSSLVYRDFVGRDIANPRVGDE